MIIDINRNGYGLSYGAKQPQEQADYIGVALEGPYKPEYYRY